MFFGIEISEFQAAAIMSALTGGCYVTGESINFAELTWSAIDVYDHESTHGVRPLAELRSILTPTQNETLESLESSDKDFRVALSSEKQPAGYPTLNRRLEEGPFCCAPNGKLHRIGCLAEECPACKRPLIGCSCRTLSMVENFRVIQTLGTGFMLLNEEQIRDILKVICDYPETPLSRAMNNQSFLKAPPEPINPCPTASWGVVESTYT